MSGMSARELLSSIESSLADISENLDLLKAVESALADIAENKSDGKLIEAIAALGKSIASLKIEAPTVNVTNQVTPTPINFEPRIEMPKPPSKFTLRVTSHDARGRIEEIEIVRGGV
ncbi:MAG: hypothetical protein ACRDAM_07050 [Casimicrobium sp.]